MAKFNFMKTREKFISIVAPVYNEEGNVKRLHEQILKIVSENKLNAEIIFVNDGSSDKSIKRLVRCVRDGENGLEWSATTKNRMVWNEAIEYAKNLVAPVYYKDKQ